MAGRTEQITKQLSQWWSSLSMNQKTMSLLTGLLFVVVAAGSVYWSTRPDYSVLYANLIYQDANAVVEHIREQKIPYRLSAGGTRVEIPSAHIYDLRLTLAGKNLPRGEGVGFEIFDKMSFGVTDDVQRINYLRALQSELERTIDNLEPVEKSRVHLVLPQEDLWFEDPLTASASVMVNLSAPGSLTPQTAESIRHLLASAVRGLTPEQVTIVDTRGKILSSGGDAKPGSGISDRQIEYQNKIETSLRQKAESLLQEILGQGKAAVRVCAEVDFDQIVKEREYYEPINGKKGLVRTEQKNNVTPAKSKKGTGGIAGTASNLQGYPPSGRRQAALSSSKNMSYTQYEMDHTIERITTATGTVKKLSVGVFIDGKPGKQALQDIQEVIAHALGIDEERGDKIQVRAISFDRKQIETQRELLEKSQKEKMWMEMATKWVPRGLLLAAAVTLLIIGMRSIRRYTERLIKIAENRNNHEDDQEWNSDKILAMIKQNPAETGQVLKHWLS